MKSQNELVVLLTGAVLILASVQFARPEAAPRQIAWPAAGPARPLADRTPGPPTPSADDPAWLWSACYWSQSVEALETPFAAREPIAWRRCPFG